MLLFTEKMIAAGIIFVVGLLCAWVPLRVPVTERSRRFFDLGETFSIGVFLGATLLHLLPDASAAFNILYPHHHFPIAPTICSASFLALLTLERGFLNIGHNELVHHPASVPLILSLALSIHSFIAGAALGVNAVFASALVIFIAIIAHKGSAAFALGITVQRSTLSNHLKKVTVLVFAFMTPIGIMFGNAFELMLREQQAVLMTGIFNAFAAGTFLYIAMLHGFDRQFSHGSHQPWPNFLSLFCGFGVMALIAIWV